ncbi:MAG TPA: putative toxin-antitoxin system toxin component, PIN family [Anaerolineae bacterium]|nr:putative toxin-antitoxin system toxin component, PIN family [Anaerolineae bacterium]
MKCHQVVIDTNVLVSALRSRKGASHRLLLLVGGARFEINVSVPLMLEYETIVQRLADDIPLAQRDIDDVLDYLCAVANRRKVFYLWRPFLRDPKDDMVLELAVTAGCDFIVTFNKKDFVGAERFGIRVVTPQEFLARIGELP